MDHGPGADTDRTPSWQREVFLSMLSKHPPMGNVVESYNRFLDLLLEIVTELGHVTAVVHSIDEAKPTGRGPASASASASAPAATRGPLADFGMMAELVTNGPRIKSPTADASVPASDGRPSVHRQRPLTPHEARSSGATYSGDVVCRTAELRFFVLRRRRDLERAAGIEVPEGKDDVRRAERRYDRWPVGQEQVVEGPCLFSMPLMTRCKACTLTRLGSDVPLVAQAERGGLLVLRGASHIVQPQKVPRPGVAVLTVGSPTESKDTRALSVMVRSMHHHRARSTATTKVFVYKDKAKDRDQAVVGIQFTNTPVSWVTLMRLLGYEGADQQAAVVFPSGDPRALSDEECEARYHVPADDARAAAERLAAIHGADPRAMTEPIEAAMARLAKREGRVPQVMRAQVLGECLTQEGSDNDDPQVMARKAHFLGACMRRLLLSRVSTERYPLDSRDFEGNQHFHMPHQALSVMLRQLFRDYMHGLRDKLFRAIRAHGARLVRDFVVANGLVPGAAADAAPRPQRAAAVAAARERVRDATLGVDLAEALRSRRLTQQIASRMCQGQVTVTKSTRSGPTVVQRANATVPPLCEMAHAHRVASPVKREGRYGNKRHYDSSKFGLMDPSATPEGESIGLVESMSLGAMVNCRPMLEPVCSVVLRLRTSGGGSGDSDASGGGDGCLVQPLLHPWQQREQQLREQQQAAGQQQQAAWIGELVMVNGFVLGHTRDAAALVAAARRARRSGLLPRLTSVTHGLDGVHVDCEDGMGMFPALLVERLRDLPPLLAECAATRTSLWERMVQEGVVEYLSPSEAFEVRVAPTWHDLCTDPRRAEAPYTHLVPHPLALLGFMSGMEPFFEHNQGPRTTYAANMLTQVVGFGHMSSGLRGAAGSMEHTAFRTWYPQRPLASTALGEAMSGGALGLVPNTQNLAVAVMDHWATIEDAVAVSRAFLERGGGRVTVYHTVRVACDPRTERFAHPDLLEALGLDGGGGVHVMGRRSHEDCSALDADGLPIVGATLRAGSVVVGRVSAVEVTDAATGNKATQWHSTSEVLREDESWVVDEVAVLEGEAVVRLRTVRAPQVGDKFTSRYGQKGTVGAVVAQEDLPFVVAGDPGLVGVVPDLIINPNAFPTRMTIGQLLEAAVSLVALRTGEPVDGTPWADRGRAARIDAATRSAQTVTMADPATGEPLGKRVAFGFVAYGRLRQMVLDKVHARSTGPKQPLTRQPTEGRTRGGGLRIGSMEREAVVSSGAAGYLMDALGSRADAATMPVCRSCGRVSSSSSGGGGGGGGGGGVPCDWCGGPVADVASNYAARLLSNEMLTMGVGMRMRLSDNAPATTGTGTGTGAAAAAGGGGGGLEA